MVYFRFLSARNAATPMMQVTATTAIMAISEVTNGASAWVGTPEEIAVESANSGSNDCAADVDSDTSIEVSENDL